MASQPDSGSRDMAFWDLDAQNEGQLLPAPSSVQPVIRTSGIVDVLFPDKQPDVRVPVSEADARLGGKYYSIVKLFIRFGDPPTWTTATGWLLRNNIAVTAAHCVYDGDGHATSIQAVVGSRGVEQQTRSATRVVVPREWTDYCSGSNSKHDVALLQLEVPFENVQPLAHGTPGLGSASADERLTVVGYPADLRVGGMPGGGMYEMGVVCGASLGETADNLMRYRGDVQGGLSGAPVIRDSDFAAVGVHIRGGSWNSAVAIGGPYGVDFEPLEEGIRLLEGYGGTNLGPAVRAGGARDWLCYLRAPPSL